MQEVRPVCRHVVLFKFKPEVAPATVREIESAFGELCRQLPFVIGYEWGINMSPEGLDRGLTHCFVLTFADEAARDRYLPHPAHVEFCKTQLEGRLDDVCVVDYLARA
jgi:hypothetical protein